MLRNIIDGWALNTNIRYLPYRATPMQLGQMEPFRRAHNYREQIWSIPEDLLVQIPARGQLNRQIRVTPNSILWGATFNRFDPTQGYTVAPPSGLSIQITDDASGCQFGSEFIQAYSLYSFVQPGVQAQGGQSITPCLLTQPRMFVAPGLISVEIANTLPLAVNVQLCLYCSEPCEMAVKGSQCI